jgi:hypothetical protein
MLYNIMNFSDNSLYTDNMVDKIEDAEIAHEKQEGILAWRGIGIACCSDTSSELPLLIVTYRSEQGENEMLCHHGSGVRPHQPCWHVQII